MDKDTIAPSTTSERPLAGNSIPIAVPLNSNDIDSFGCSTLPWNRSPYLLRQCAPAFQNDGNVASTMMELSKTRLRTTETSISSKTYNSSIFFLQTICMFSCRHDVPKMSEDWATAKYTIKITQAINASMIWLRLSMPFFLLFYKIDTLWDTIDKKGLQKLMRLLQ